MFINKVAHRQIGDSFNSSAMLKVFSLKNQQKKEAPNGSPTSSSSTSPTSSSSTPSNAASKKSSAAQLRITKGFISVFLPSRSFVCKNSIILNTNKDMNELTLPTTCQLDFPDKDDLLNFKLIICPDEGFYKGGRFVFNFKISLNYPHEAPKIKCETQVYHPNIDMDGNVCLNILR